MTTRPPNDQGVSLAGITTIAFAAYNRGGPPDRANLTHDDRPVPPLEATGPSVQHKWTVASSAAAIAGAEYIIGLVAVGVHDPAKLLASMHFVLDAPAWVPTIRYEAELLAKGYESKTSDGRALAMARTLRELVTLPGVGNVPAAFFAAAARALIAPREAEPVTPPKDEAAAKAAAKAAKAAKEKADARTAELAEWLDAWPTKEQVPLVGAITVWRAIAAGLQTLHDRGPLDARARYAPMISMYRAEADYLEQLVS